MSERLWVAVEHARATLVHARAAWPDPAVCVGSPAGAEAALWLDGQSLEWTALRLLELTPGDEAAVELLKAARELLDLVGRVQAAHAGGAR